MQLVPTDTVVLCHLCATVENTSIGRSSTSVIQKCTFTSHVSCVRLQPGPVDVTFEEPVIWALVRFQLGTHILTLSRIFSRMLLLWFRHRLTTALGRLAASTAPPLNTGVLISP